LFKMCNGSRIDSYIGNDFSNGSLFLDCGNNQLHKLLSSYRTKALTSTGHCFRRACGYLHGHL